MVNGAWKRGRYRWVVADSQPGAEELSRQVGTTNLIASVLHNRGINDADSARAFLNPKLTDLHDPLMLAGVSQAAKRIARAAADGEKILIYGDYDVDGITGVAILHSCLKMLGSDAEFHIPHRLDEGYGVNSDAIEKFISSGVNLMVTVDCGIGACDAIGRAVAGGLDVIVTDHHTPSANLPKDAIIVHPNIPEGKYPNASLCGAGVAFKLAWQVAREHCGSDKVDDALKDFLINATSLAALGTIADVVPLVGENRTLCAFGLKALPQSNLAGVRAILKAASLTSSQPDSFDVGFKIAPRINAAGRMGHAREAVEMLTTADAERADEIAKYLTKQNEARRKVERKITDEAIEKVQQRGLDGDENKSIVLWSADWHGGVVGIVASRMVDRFYRPTIIIAQSEDGTGQGSGRSIAGFNMVSALDACGGHLNRFGGHAMAGGIGLDMQNAQEFADAFEKYAREHLSGEPLEPILEIDAEVKLSELTYNTVERFSHLAPFGRGNAQPIVLLRDCEIITPARRIGKTGKTVGVLLGQGDDKIRAVGFSMGDLADELEGVKYADFVAQPVLNTFNGRTSVQLYLVDAAWK